MSQTITRTVEKYDDNSIKVITTVVDISEQIFTKEQLCSQKQSEENNVLRVKENFDNWNNLLVDAEELGIKSREILDLEKIEKKVVEEKV